ncbi:MAG: divergent polysaccharide deacetylase family protein [Candidatus Hydrogenedentes bacterium]|nr:divergent polysaccharide deacetylase family protein [Candidatus Hydrogenedentota bacterium]
MSEEQEIEQASDLPHSWTGLGAAFLALSVAALIAGYLIVQFVTLRPFDLYMASEERDAELMAILTSNQVPPDMIERSEKLLMEDRTARWYARRYDAHVPSTVSLEGLNQVIGRSKNPDVFVDNLLEDGEKVGLSFATGNYPFAELRLHTSEPCELPELTPPPSAIREPKQSPPAPTAPKEPEDTAPVAVEPLEPPTPLDVEPWKVANANIEIPQKKISSPLPPDAPKLAILVDDGGHSASIAEALLAMDPVLTLAILPYTPHGEATAKRAAELDFEILLHMPMDNLDESKVHEGQLKTGMAEDEMLRFTEAALAQVPGAVGINNHEGTKFIADGKPKALFIDIIKNRDLFFIDSRTVVDTKAYDMAAAFGVPASERDLFLEHDKRVDLIRRRFDEVLSIACAKGQAIAICHFRPNTVTVLQESLPQLEEQGIRLVHASELIQ